MHEAAISTLLPAGVRHVRVAEIRSGYLEGALTYGTVTSNADLRWIQHHRHGMEWLMKSVIRRLQCSKPVFKPNRVSNCGRRRATIAQEGSQRQR